MSKAFLPGHETWYASDSPASEFSAVFEDDGETGYFYACDRAGGGRVLDAVHVYSVRSVVDKDRQSLAEIVWSADGMKAALLINDHADAVIDFAKRCSYCRSEFPSPASNWHRGEWSDQLMEDFRVE